MSDITVNLSANRIFSYGVQNTAARTSQSKTAANPTDIAVRAQDTVTISEEGHAAAQSVASVGSSSTTAAATGETTFKSSTEAYTDIVVEKKMMVQEYYGKQHQENMKFSDPLQHIRDKYQNKNSQYFRSDMTAREREIAMQQEKALLYGGRLKVNYEDYVFNGMENEMTLSHMTMTANQRSRDQIEGAINNTLMQNGITLPEGASFTLSVDPYDYHISVQGLEDTTIAKLIEQLLNQGDNGSKLYDHIRECDPEMFGFEVPEQYTKLDERKSGLYLMVKDQTGLDIRTLERKNGAILTPDGKDLWEVLEEIAKTLPVGDGKMGADFSYYKPAYDEVAKYGWTDGSGLALEYRNGSLYDIGTENGYGPGQTAWQDWVRNNPAEVADRVMKYVNERAIELQVQREEDF